MSNLPQSTILGNLEMIEVYEYYDQPCLFACRNLSGQIFIAVWVDRTEFGNTWLYAPVSSRRFKLIRGGAIDLRSIFKDSEDAFIFEVTIPLKETEITTVKAISCSDIEEDYLPEKGEIIEIDDADLLFTEKNSDPEEKDINLVAVKKKREIINFTLYLKAKYGNEAPIGGLGTILASFQETVSAIGQIKDRGTESNIIPLDVIEKTELAISKIFQGSFGMRLEGLMFEEDLFGESLLGKCIDELIQLIKIGSNTEGLHAKLSNLKKRSAFKYKNFLEALSKLEIIKAKLDWASPTPGKGGSVEIALSSIEEAIEIIDNTRLKSERTYEIIVKVVMIHYETKKIVLKGLSPGKPKYKCEIADGAISDVETISKSLVYLATLQDIIVLSTIIDKEIHEYELLGLKVYDEPSQPNLFDLI